MIERIIVDPPADANYRGPRAALSAEQIRDVQTRLRAGVRARDLATTYGVSSRAIYRYGRFGAPRLIVVGQWEAEFYDRGDDEPPSQVSPWRRR